MISVDKIWEGIITGAAGGASAGAILAILKVCHEVILKKIQTKRIILWLEKVTKLEGAELWRSTHAISSYTNLTEDRVRYLCSESHRITRSSGEKETWGLTGVARDKSTTGAYFKKKQETNKQVDKMRP